MVIVKVCMIFLSINYIYHFSGILRIFGIANLQQWMFFSFLDVLLMFVEKSEVIFFFSGMKQVQLWDV